MKTPNLGLILSLWQRLKEMLKQRFPAMSGVSKKVRRQVKVGLDWGFSSIKIVILEPRDSGYVLADARIIKLPSGKVNLDSLLKDIDFSSGVNLGICGPNVIVRYVTLAKMNDEEFKNSLRYEAASHLPFPLEEVNLDAVMLKGLPENQMLVMLAAAKKNFIEQRLKLFQDSNIKVNILDIDSLALINAFNFTHPQAGGKDETSGAVALLNIGSSVTNINILEDGIPHFSRDINVAGRDFSDPSSREVALNNFISEIRKSFDYYEAGTSASVNKIFVSGGGSLFADIINSLKTLIGIQVEEWDPFVNFDFSPNLEKKDIKKNSAQFAVAVGLALR